MSYTRRRRAAAVRLRSARVQNYRSIIDSGVVEFDPEVTSVVGMTGSGKTSFLKMLAGASHRVRFVESELPRASSTLRRLRDGSLGADQIAQLSAIFEVEEGDRPYLPEQFREVKNIAVSRTFDGQIKVSADGVALDRDSMDAETGHMHSLLDQLEDMLGGAAKAAHANSPDEAATHAEIIQDSLEEFRRADILSRSELRLAIETLRNTAYSIPLDENQMGEIENTLHEMSVLGDSMQARLRQDPVAQLYRQIPKPLYREGVFEMDDEIAIDEFVSDPDASRTFRSISVICGFSPSSLQKMRNANPAEQSDYLATKSKILSRRLNCFWSQEKYEFRLSIDGDALRLQVSDKTTKAITPASERSEGFKWWVAFFLEVSSFLVRGRGRRIILLDNPATTLHDKGKDDVLRFIQTAAVSDRLQIVYSTHERALINPWRTDRIRVVELTDRGTKVSPVPAKSSRGLLETIMKNIGSPARYSLFGAPRMVCFEGASDTYIASAVNEYISQTGDEESLDKDSYSLNSFGGVDAAPQACGLYKSLGLEFVMVVDSGTATEAMKRKLGGERIFEEHFVELRQVLSRDADIEDMVDREIYYEAFRRAYGNMLAGSLPPLDVIDSNLQKKRVNNYERWFLENKKGAFSKTLVAQQMFGVMMERDNGGTAKAVSLERTRKNFAELFRIVAGKYGG